MTGKKAAENTLKAVAALVAAALAFIKFMGYADKIREPDDRAD